MNRSLRLAQVCVAGILLIASASIARAGGVTVGSSSLISHLDYSDTFTLTASGGEASRTPNTFPVLRARLERGKHLWQSGTVVGVWAVVDQ